MLGLFYFISCFYSESYSTNRFDKDSTLESLINKIAKWRFTIKRITHITLVKSSYFYENLTFRMLLNSQNILTYIFHLVPTRHNVQYINNQVNCEIFLVLNDTWHSVIKLRTMNHTSIFGM